MPTGATCCNDGFGYCDAGKVCVGNRQCCPASNPGCAAPVPSPTPTASFCPAGEQPCDGECMPTGATCCNDGFGYCDAGKVCVGNQQCCPASDPGCAAPVPTPTPTGSFCPAGEVACDTQCMPTGATCCHDGFGYCDAGKVCVGNQQCCPASDPNCAAPLTISYATTPSVTHIPAGTSTTRPTSTAHTAIIQTAVGAAQGGHSEGSQLYALMVAAAGQFLMM